MNSSKLFEKLLFEELLEDKKVEKKNYDKKKDKPSVVVSVIGNQNKGKSWILGKISGEEIPKGLQLKQKV